MATDDDILKELQNISKMITISNGSSIEKELKKYVTSEDREKIWVLIDGKNQVNEIAKIVSRTRRAVDIFLKILEGAGLVERPYNKPPIRRLDYVPPSWTKFLEETGESEGNKGVRNTKGEQK